MTELSPDAEFVRFVQPLPEMIAPGETGFDWAALRPSSGDESSAKRRGHPVRVSVWDASRTTMEQGRAFLDPARTYMAGKCAVRTVLAFRDAAGVDDAERRARSRLRVCYDPLDPPDDARPGAEGHSGMEGLDRTAGESRVLWKNRLRLLAAHLVPVA